MTPTAKKKEFVKLRAEGYSYSKCCSLLQISKSTCSRWATELHAEIASLENEQLDELRQLYGMSKRARIKALGDTITRIDSTLSRKQLDSLKPDKLLELRLRYSEALRSECLGTAPAIKLEGIEVHDIIAALGDLLNRVRAGEVTNSQAKNESVVLSELLKAYDLAEVRNKLDELAALIEDKPGSGPVTPEGWKEV